MPAHTAGAGHAAYVPGELRFDQAIDFGQNLVNRIERVSPRAHFPCVHDQPWLSWTTLGRDPRVRLAKRTRFRMCEDAQLS